MKKRYKVKLNNPKVWKKGVNNKGYLDGGFGKIGSYTRGDAIKKARMFDGTIEEIKPTFYITDTKVAQIPENQLLDGVVKELKGREMFVDADPNESEERFYSGDVFEQILGEQGELQKAKMFRITNIKVLNQLEELADALGEYHYVQITTI